MKRILKLILACMFLCSVVFIDAGCRRHEHHHRHENRPEQHQNETHDHTHDHDHDHGENRTSE